MNGLTLFLFFLEWLPLILVLIFVFYLIKIAGKWKKNLMKEKPKRRFRYLDTFFYYFSQGGETNRVAYHVVSEIGTSKIYAFMNDKTIDCYFCGSFGKLKIQTSTGLFKKNIDILPGHEGSFWIDEEHSESFSFKSFGGKVLTYGGIYNYQNRKLQDYTLYNFNSDYDISLLEKAVFISGVGSFDK